LRDGAITVGIAPDCGGSLTRFDVRIGEQTVDVLRPWAEPPPGLHRSLGAACFPLVPYGGRLREGRFCFGDRQFQYPLNALPERHSSHGDGWTRPWNLDQLDRRRATMSLEADAAAPFEYRCSQSLTLTPAGLSITLSARNLSPYRVPLGFGLHPYFANRPQARVTMTAPRRWRWDAEMMPIAEESNPNAEGFTNGQAVAGLPVAAEYADWNGAAIIDWPESRLRVKLQTRPPLRHVVMWMPEGEDFFCFEPISHASDALNRQTMAGFVDGFGVLEPNAAAEQKFDFQVSLVDPGLP
jgi:aldose 1-epimerase